MPSSTLLAPEAPATFTQRRVAIVGLGLMGGSLGLALRAAGHRGEIVGVARRSETVRAALDLGAIDRGSTSLADVTSADVVVLATPVRVILHHIVEVAPFLTPGTLLIDLGSTKQTICAALAAVPAPIQVIGGHPMCGKERAGIEVADAALYQDKTFILCPLPRTGEAALATALALVHSLAARPLLLDPDRHDQLVAAVSHVPYVLSTALMTATAAGDGLAWSVAASGFRDTTRLAGSDPDMMLDIMLTNQVAILTALDRVRDVFESLRGWLAAGDEAALRTAFASAQQLREDYLAHRRGSPPASTHATAEDGTPLPTRTGDVS